VGLRQGAPAVFTLSCMTHGVLHRLHRRLDAARRRRQQLRQQRSALQQVRSHVDWFQGRL
jgi:hypothetical protein